MKQSCIELFLKNARARGVGGGEPLILVEGNRKSVANNGRLIQGSLVEFDRKSVVSVSAGEGSETRSGSKKFEKNSGVVVVKKERREREREEEEEEEEEDLLRGVNIGRGSKGSIKVLVEPVKGFNPSIMVKRKSRRLMAEESKFKRRLCISSSSSDEEEDVVRRGRIISSSSEDGIEPSFVHEPRMKVGSHFAMLLGVDKSLQNKAQSSPTPLRCLGQLQSVVEQKAARVGERERNNPKHNVVDLSGDEETAKNSFYRHGHTADSGKLTGHASLDVPLHSLQYLAHFPKSTTVQTTTPARAPAENGLALRELDTPMANVCKALARSSYENVLRGELLALDGKDAVACQLKLRQAEGKKVFDITLGPSDELPVPEGVDEVSCEVKVYKKDGSGMLDIKLGSAVKRGLQALPGQADKNAGNEEEQCESGQGRCDTLQYLEDVQEPAQAQSFQTQLSVGEREREERRRRKLALAEKLGISSALAGIQPISCRPVRPLGKKLRCTEDVVKKGGSQEDISVEGSESLVRDLEVDNYVLPSRRDLDSDYCVSDRPDREFACPPGRFRTSGTGKESGMWSEDFMEAPITDYEMQREANIKRNKDFLKNLGISSSVLVNNSPEVNVAPRVGRPCGKKKFRFTDIKKRGRPPGSTRAHDKSGKHSIREEANGRRNNSPPPQRRKFLMRGQEPDDCIIVPTISTSRVLPVDSAEARAVPVERTSMPVERRDRQDPCSSRQYFPGERGQRKELRGFERGALLSEPQEKKERKGKKGRKEALEKTAKKEKRPYGYKKMQLGLRSAEEAAPVIDKPPMLEIADSKPEYITLDSPQSNSTSTRSHPKETMKQSKKHFERRMPVPFEPAVIPDTNYELERNETIRENNSKIQDIVGVPPILGSKPPVLPQRTVRTYMKRWTSKPNPAFRRTTRRLALETASSMSQSEKIVVTVKQEYPQQYDGPSVLKYVCGGGTGNSLDTGCSGVAPGPAAEIVAIKPHHGVGFQDSALGRMYSMDIVGIAGHGSRRSGLLAVGGQRGRISIFGISGDDGEDTEVVRRGRDPLAVPLFGWRGSRSWISHVQFLPESQCHGTLLMTSSNDGKVALWDIMKRSSSRDSAGKDFTALRIFELGTIHSAGIFSMHERCGTIATAAKDSCVAISVVRGPTIERQRLIYGHHTGVIRGVRFRDTNVLADCGADTHICIMDLRLEDPCILRVRDTHETGVNVIDWSPGNENILLSASNDPHLYIHDIRKPRTALYQLTGHVQASRTFCDHMYRPTFVGDGNIVATPGEGSQQISLYSLQHGQEADQAKVISRGFVGYDASVAAWTNATNDEGGLWLATNQHIRQYQPVWQLRQP